jgi:phosphomevalonate kinase
MDKENKMANPRLSAGINNNGGKNVNPLYKAASTLTSYVGNVAREIRDIPTAVGNLVPGSGYSAKDAASVLAKQVKEAGAAVTAGQKGSETEHIDVRGKMRGVNLRKK